MTVTTGIFQTQFLEAVQKLRMCSEFRVASAQTYGTRRAGYLVQSFTLTFMFNLCGC